MLPISSGPLKTILTLGCCPHMPGTMQIKPCDMVLAMECSEKDMRSRLLERGKTSGRADDNEETIVKRFRTFVEQSKPVIEHFKVPCIPLACIRAIFTYRKGREHLSMVVRAPLLVR
jgi:hypothetical protein